MLRISNTVIGVLNILTLLLGVFAVGGSIYIHIHGANATGCEKVVRYPLLIGGLFVVALSALGIMGSLYRVNVAMYIYIFLMLLFIVGLIVFAIVAELATNRKLRRKLSMNQHDEKRLEFFQDQLQRYVMNEEDWRVVKSCLMDAHLCRNLPIDGGRKNHPNIFKHWSRPQVKFILLFTKIFREENKGIKGSFICSGIIYEKIDFLTFKSTFFKSS